MIGRVAARAAIAGILLALNGTASAQAIYPSKPVRLIVPYAPGGGTSVVSRLLGQKLSELWKYQVIVDNRPGGNTIIGSELMEQFAALIRSKVATFAKVVKAVGITAN